ncbi:glycosyltransferase family 9 protein [Candidatus Margulisiibacteriota bacterium]
MATLDESRIKKILIIRPDRIGDLLMTTPAISILRKRFPNAHISILAGEYARGVIEGNPDVNEVIIDELQKGKKKNLFQYLSYVKKFKAMKFDLCVNYFNDENQYALLPFLARIPYRIADRSRIAGAWLSNLGTFLRRKDLSRHMVEFNADMLAPLNVKTNDLKMKLSVSQKAEEAVNKKLKDFGFKTPIIGLHLGTGNNKPWSAKNYAKLADAMANNFGASVILTGGKREIQRSEEVINLCKSKPLNMAAKTTLEGLAALIKKCDIFAGVDTGPTHIAAALGIPVAVLYTAKRIKPATWGPWGTRNTVVRPHIKCSLPCFSHKCPENYCTEQIPMEEVLKSIEVLLKDGGNKTIAGSKNDWLKKSLNIMVVCSTHDRKKMSDTEKNMRLLRDSGYHVILVSPAGHPLIQFAHDELMQAYELNFKLPAPSTIKGLLKIIIDEDINLIHRMDNSGALSLNLAFLLSAIKLPASITVLKDRGILFQTADEVVEFYKEVLRKAVV